MIGLVLAVLYALLLFSRDVNGFMVLKRSSHFLYRWYITVAVIATVSMAFITMSAGLSLSGFIFGPIGWLIGLVGGAVVTAAVLLYALVGYALEVLGAILLHKSVVLNPDTETYTKMSFAKLIVGVIALVLGILFVPVIS